MYIVIITVAWPSDPYRRKILYRNCTENNNTVIIDMCRNVYVDGHARVCDMNYMYIIMYRAQTFE